MKLPAPAALLRHRPPALRLRAIEELGEAQLTCAGEGAGLWRWPDMLEGAAQAAGLLAGLQPDGPSNRAVIAEYRSVVIHAAAHAGPLRFVARFERRILRFWQCAVEARAADGRVMLAARVTVAPGLSEPG